MARPHRIDVLTPRSDGSYRVETVLKRKKKRKISKRLKPLEKRQRRRLDAIEVWAGELNRRNKRSNRKKRNGFVRDARTNRVRALRKALKEL